MYEGVVGIENGKEIFTLAEDMNNVGSLGSVCFSPDGKRIVSGHVEDCEGMGRAERGQEVLTLKHTYQDPERHAREPGRDGVFQ